MTEAELAQARAAAIEEAAKVADNLHFPAGTHDWGYLDDVAAAIRALASKRAAPAPSGEEMVLVPRELIERFPEINPWNYDHDDACFLNAWGCEVAGYATPTTGERA